MSKTSGAIQLPDLANKNIGASIWMSLKWQFFKSVSGVLLFFGCWVVSDSLWPHGWQHARPPCPSLSHRVSPNSCPFNRWYHPTISFSTALLSLCPQSFPASGSFSISQLFASGGQSIGASAWASVLPMNIQDRSSLGLTGLIYLLAVQETVKSSPAAHSWY